MQFAGQSTCGITAGGCCSAVNVPQHGTWPPGPALLQVTQHGRGAVAARSTGQVSASACGSNTADHIPGTMQATWGAGAHVVRGWRRFRDEPQAIPPVATSNQTPAIKGACSACGASPAPVSARAREPEPVWIRRRLEPDSRFAPRHLRLSGLPQAAGCPVAG